MAKQLPSPRPVGVRGTRLHDDAHIPSEASTRLDRIRAHFESASPEVWLDQAILIAMVAVCLVALALLGVSQANGSDRARPQRAELAYSTPADRTAPTHSGDRPSARTANPPDAGPASSGGGGMGSGVGGAPSGDCDRSIEHVVRRTRLFSFQRDRCYDRR